MKAFYEYPSTPPTRKPVQERKSSEESNTPEGKTKASKRKIYRYTNCAGETNCQEGLTIMPQKVALINKPLVYAKKSLEVSTCTLLHPY